MKNLLLVEDEIHVVSFIKTGLTEEKFDVTVALDGKTGLELALQNSFDLIILDIMLPEINGLEVCSAIRKVDSTTPILFLTALGAAENVVLGLNNGADDYLVKPFKFIELLARINSLLRRTNGSISVTKLEERDNIYSFDDLELDDDAKTVKRREVKISLTTTEYRLLLYFLKNKNRVLSRTDILENVWDVNFDMGTNVVDVYVNYLRKKIDLGDSNKIIHTVVGMGYVLKIDN
ncbi:response regulator transcription factor [Fulvivirga sp.]|uniref:response regulator transcription factor n=1 Tax=Fulvivirga sp. TaxID=1931237 RepID=UPI0032EF25DA